MARDPVLSRSPLFADLPDDELDALGALMKPRTFAAGEELCRAGEPSDRVWLITAGLVNWLAPTTARAGDIGLRLRKGDVIGAQDAITGEQRSATVVASLPTSTLELSAEDLADVAQRHPQILFNIVRTLRERLSRASAQSAVEELGEEIGLVAGPSLKDAIGMIVGAADTATPRPVTVLDKRLSFAGALTEAEQLAPEHATVLIPAELDPETLAVLMNELDRVVVLVGDAAEAGALAKLFDATERGRLEIVLVGEEAEEASKSWRPGPQELIVRTCRRQTGYPLGDADLAWLARHLTRTKFGLALGAGGAKGFAHVGVLQVVEEAGYTIDYVGGSSIGGFVASHVGLGYNASEIDARFRRAFDPETVKALFANPLGGGGAALEALTGLLREATEERWFTHSVMPLVIMTVDLTDRAPLPLRSGPLWEALLAALSVAGVFPAVERDGHRLVDGIALVPVPTASVYEDGADLVLSCNLMGAETLDSWPEGVEVEVEPPKKRRRGMLDTMLEVMDLSQLDTATRHAALADVTVTPVFAASDWRDFHLADLFLAAGRSAAEQHLPALQALSQPVDLEAARRKAALTTPV
jgi:predicted acylesterase/phospholipase RssA/CRP-like cAMP-binding protein